jgi:predicted DNA-binding transcriptional regulator AlpA
MTDAPSDSASFYSFEETMKLLGKKKSTLYREAEEGKIPFDLPPDKKIGMRFPKEAIDTLVKRQRKEQASKRAMHLRFEASTTSDLWTAVDNARRIYGPDDVISFERALEWRDINPDISMSVKQGKLLVGMVTFLPLDEQVILALLHDAMRERDIPDQAIRRWTDPQISVYTAGIATISTGKPQIDRQRGRFLIRHAIKWAITLSSQYDIKNWYGIGVTSEGQSLLETLGFHEIMSLENGARKGYVLDSMLTNPAKLIRGFLRGMEDDNQ